MRFFLNPTQRFYQSQASSRDLILKARQKGISSYILADQFIDCVRKPTNAIVISHEKEATQRLLAKVKYFIANIELKPVIKYETRQDLVFEKTNSSFFIGTVGQKTVGRGETLHRVHCSEAAYFFDADKIMAGITEAVPLLFGRITVESTPNGRSGWFYNEWQKAKEKQSSFKPVFISWFIDDEYKLSDSDIISLELSPEAKERILMSELTDEEKELVKINNLTIEQIRWRRFKKWDLGELFFQEYPENDVDCFLQSGRPVFRIVEMVRKESEAGLKIDKNYIAGLDPAEGIIGGDNHCLAVIDPDIKPAQVVYELCSNEPIDFFLNRVKDLMSKFKIKLCVETHNIGVAHCQKLKEMRIPFREWETTATTRPIMIVELEEAYRKKELLELYPEAKNELLDMFYDDRNRPDHRRGRHDDRVFARAIAWQQRKVPEPNIRFL